MQFTSINQFLNEARKQGQTWDVETLGFDRGQSMYSASRAYWGVKKPTTVHFDVTKDLPNASVFGRTGYENMVKEYSKIYGHTPKTSTYKDFGKSFIKSIKDKPYVFGHNPQYDFGWMYESLPKGERAALQMQFSGTSDERLDRLREKVMATHRDPNHTGPRLSPDELAEYKKRKFAYGKIGTGGGIIGESIKRARNGTSFYPAYATFLNQMSDARNKGLAVSVDTNQMAKIFAGLASDVNLIGDRKGIGTKLELLTEALGVSSAGAHTDLDVIFGQKLPDAFARGDIDKMAAFSRAKLRGELRGDPRMTLGSLSEGGQNIVKYMKMIAGETEGADLFKELDYESLEEFNFRNTVGGMRASWEDTLDPATGKAAVPIKHKMGREPVLATTYPRIRKHLEKVYSKTPEQIDDVWKSYGEKFAGASREVNQQFLVDENTKVINAIKGGIKQYVNPTAQKNIFSNDILPSSTWKEALTSPTTKKLALWGAGAVIGATAISALSGGYKAPEASRISSNDDDYNTIEGLRHGGVAQQMRRALTDFGSGWKGPDVLMGVAAGLVGLSMNSGLDKEEVKNKAGFLAATGAATGAMSLAGIVTPGDILSKKFKISPGTKSAFTKIGTGYSIGAIFGLSFTAKDDAYNTIEGLRHGGVAEQMRKQLTDFGSGYQGPNPQLNPEYNKAEDVYKYEWMRASKIGLSEADMYKYMTEESEEVSEYVSASANAGTALHEYLASLDYQEGVAMDTEQLVLDRSHQISGHIDVVRNDMGVGDYKTVSNGIFNTIRETGKPKDMHRSQVMYYLGQTGQQSGFIQYTNRDNIRQNLTYHIKFDPHEYTRLISKVERVRARVMEDISTGRLNKSNMPMAAGPDTLLEADANRPSPQQQVMDLDERRKIFHEEMQYLNTVKRGMPKYGAGAARIKKKRRDQQSTQGMGLQIYNNRNKHHVM